MWASSTCTAASRSMRWGRGAKSSARRPCAAASRWCSTASVAIRTRSPARCARQQKSTSSRNSGSARSKPSSRCQTSRRTNMPAELTASTSRTPSCCPWSCSLRSRPVYRRPELVMLTPTSSSSRRSCQPRIFGPRMAALGLSSAVFNSASKQAGSAALSSCSNHNHSTSSSTGSALGASCTRPTWATPARTASPKPWCESPSTTRSAPNAERSCARLPSVDPVSTPTTASGGRVCPAKVVRAAGSQTAPSWLTRIAVTWW